MALLERSAEPVTFKGMNGVHLSKCLILGVGAAKVVLCENLFLCETKMCLVVRLELPGSKIQDYLSAEYGMSACAICTCANKAGE